MLNDTSKAVESSAKLPPPSTGALGIGPHLHGPATRAGNGAADEHQVLVGDDLDHGQAALGDAPAAHPARTAHALEHPRRRRRRADRARRTDVVRAVRFRSAREVVALDRSLEALALGLARDLDVVADGERLDGHGLTHEQLARLVAELREVAVCGRVGLLQVPELGLGDRLLLALPERQLDRLVAVALDGADRGHGTRAGLEHGHALDASIVEEPLRHTELLGEDRGHRSQDARRISISTPAGRWSRRWSESTVFGVGWWMSISRLCVRISKCSRESLSLNGERITQYTFFSVGSGTGPETVAPVRVAVSTISFAAVSIAVWS